MTSRSSRLTLTTSFTYIFLSTACGLFGQTLTHRYSFNGDANDSVGTANGTLQGSASVDSSMLQLDGGGFVSLPANLINGYDQLSVEFWVTYATNAVWTRTFAFG